MKHVKRLFMVLALRLLFTAKVLKNGEERTIFVQAFERTVPTYDRRNPAVWQVEKGNMGAGVVLEP